MLLRKKPVKDQKQPTITVIHYQGETAEEFHPDTLEACLALPIWTSGVVWLNIDHGLDAALLPRLVQAFALKDLPVDTMLNVQTPARVIAQGEWLALNYILFYLQVKRGYVDFDEMVTGQSYLIVKNKLLISIQEKQGEAFEPVRERIRQDKGQIRSMGADFLFYALIDTAVHHYAFIMDCLHVLEYNELKRTRQTLKVIFRLKLKMKYMQESSWGLVRNLRTLPLLPSAAVGVRARHYIEISVGEFIKDIHRYSSKAVEQVEASQREVSRGLARKG